MTRPAFSSADARRNVASQYIVGNDTVEEGRAPYTELHGAPCEDPGRDDGAHALLCTAGSIDRDIHDHVPPLDRPNAEQLLMRIRQRKYSVLHAPRHTGNVGASRALPSQAHNQSRSEKARLRS